MKNSTVIAQNVLARYCEEHASYCERFHKRNDIKELELDYPKSKGHELYIFTKQTLSRHIVTELRGYKLERSECDGAQYVNSDKKRYVIESALYPADCFTRRELGHSIPVAKWKNVTYLPVVPLENRLAYHERNRQIYEYYKVVRAIIRYSGKVTRIIEGKSWDCARLDNNTYLVLCPEEQFINDEISESLHDGMKNFDEFYAVYMSQDKTPHEKRAQLVSKAEYDKRPRLVKRTHIRPNRIEQVPFSKCVVRN